MAPGLSVFIIASNVENDISDCIESIRPVADEIIVVMDDRSADKTEEIVREKADHVFSRTFTGFSDMKQYAMDQCNYDWVINIDTDERPDRDLIEALGNIKNSSPDTCAGYQINRLPFFLGKSIRHCGWYPDWVLRVVYKEHAHYPQRDVHERLEVNGEISNASGLLLHYTADDFGLFLEKQKTYAGLSSRTPSFINAILRAPVAFLRSYILKLGFLDGWRGLLVSYAQCYYTFHKYRSTDKP